MKKNHSPYVPLKRSQRFPMICAAALSVLLSVGCSSSDDDDADSSTGDTTSDTLAGQFVALAATRADDYSSGQLERFTVTDGQVSSEQFAVAGSDIAAGTDGTAYYQLGRFGVDSITRYDSGDLATPVYQRSVNGDEVSANPYQMVFVSASKAYVLRYGSGKIWIVDPSAELEENFKIGEIDLSAHDVDGVPDISEGLLVGDKLYVLMERLESFSPVKNGRIAVIDTTTDSEVSAGDSPGIDLNVANPRDMQHLEADGMLYVVGRGNDFAADASAGDRYTGGVDLVDPVSFTATLLLDDGDETTNNGFFNRVVVASAAKAYVVTQAVFGVNTLREMNPVTGALVDGAVGSYDAISITTVALDPVGQVWVGMGDATAPGFSVFDPVLETGSTFIPSTLIPINVVFAE